MKHIIISAVCVVVVFIYSFFTMFYINDFSKQAEGILASHNDGILNIKEIATIEELYSNKKSTLKFMLNRDHTDRIEEILINLSTAAKFKDDSDMHTNVLMLKTVLDDIKTSNGFTI